MTTFTPLFSHSYVSEFTRYEVATSKIQCIDSTNKANTYNIPLPTDTQRLPPIINQTTIPTLNMVDSTFIRQPYYELYITATTPTNPTPHDIVYSLRYKFMNQCSDFGNLLVRNFIWNHTRAYVYERGGDTYPFAFPTYDIVIPYALASGVIVMGMMLFVGACATGTPGCPAYTWANRQNTGI